MVAPGTGGGGNQIGLQAVFDLSAFMDGANKYNAYLDSMNEKTGNAVNVLGTVSTATIALGSALGNLASDALQKAVGFVEDLISSGIVLAAKEQQLSYIDQALGIQYGKTTTQIQDVTTAITQYGIRLDVAQGVVAQFLRYNLDLAKAVDLAKVAQNSATVVNKSASETLQNLLWGIQTQYTRVLHSAGVMVTIQKATEDYAKALHVNTNELTVNQRQQALLDAIIQEGQRNAGLYGIAMETVNMRLRQLRANELPSLGAMLAGPFLNAWTVVVNMMRNVVSGFNKAFQEGGNLHNIIIYLGAAAELVANQFYRLEQRVMGWIASLSVGGDAVIKLSDDISINVSQLVSQFLHWGVSMGIELANGLAQGAVYVFQVLAWIADQITSLLQPGSPPKILPDLDKWGKAAAEIYLRGWATGDFSAFDTLAQEIETFVRSLDIPEKDVIPKILGSREYLAEIVEQVRSTGNVTADAINKIVNATGNHATAFRDYIRLTLQAIAVDQKLADAKLDLKRITDEYDKILTELNAQLAKASNVAEQERLKELNDALATGKLTTEEKARVEAEKSQILLRQQIADTEAQRDADLGAAQAKVDAAQAASDALHEQISLQKSQLDIQNKQNQLIKQQIDLLERLAKQKQKGGGGAGEEEFIPPGGVGVGGISDKIKAEVEAAKARLAEAAKKLLETSGIDTLLKKLEDLNKAADTFRTEHWDPLVKAITDPESANSPLMKDLKWLWEHIGGIAAGIGTFILTLKGLSGLMEIATVTGTGGVLVPLLFGPGITSLAEAGGLSAILGGALMAVLVGALALAVGGLVAEIIILGPGIKENWSVIWKDLGTILEYYTPIWNQTIVNWATKAKQDINDWVTQAGKDINSWTTQAVKDFLAWSDQAGTDISDWVTQAGKDINSWVTQAAKDIAGWASQAALDISGWASGAGEDISGWVTDIGKKISDWVTQAGKDISGFISNTLNPVTNAFNGIKTSVDNIITSIGTMLTKLANAVIPDWLQRHSPSPIEQTFMGMSMWLKQLSNSDLPLFNTKLGLLNHPLYGSVSSAQYSYNYYTVDRSVKVGPISPNYMQSQSPVGIYHDITAALAAVRM